jgi:hypothetical protein
MNLFISVARGLIASLIISLTLCTSAYAENPDGTYRLVMRKLADGTVLTPPVVQGMGTFRNGVYQLTLFWRTPDGKPASLSRISKWEWSETEVAATPMVFVIDDGSGKQPVYEWGGDTRRVPVTRQGRRISHQHPLDPVVMVWEGDKETATIEGVLVDTWERVK